MLSGREVNRLSRRLTLGKDVLIGASLVTGIASVLLGRALGRRVRHEATLVDREKTETLRRAVGRAGLANLAANIGVLGVTAALAMQGSRSSRFALFSRRLP
jgi:hypothetical protein